MEVGLFFVINGQVQRSFRSLAAMVATPGANLNNGLRTLDRSAPIGNYLGPSNKVPFLVATYARPRGASEHSGEIVIFAALPPRLVRVRIRIRIPSADVRTSRPPALGPLRPTSRSELARLDRPDPTNNRTLPSSTYMYLITYPKIPTSPRGPAHIPLP